MTDDLQRQLDSIAHVGAERALLSIALKNPETLFDISLEVSADDFNNFANRSVYQIMTTILDRKFDNIGRVNPVVIHSLAQANGIAEDIGGMPYLEILNRTDAGEENMRFYLEKVKQASIRRSSFKKALTVIDDAISCEDEDVDSFVSRQEEKFLDIVMDSKSTTDAIVKMGSIVKTTMEKVSTTPRDILGVPTGYEEYDRATGGLVPGRLKVVGATAKTGKSAHALNIAKHIALEVGLPVLYIDTEMPTEEQLYRLTSIVATETGTIVPESAITRGLYTRNQEMKFAVDDYATPLIENAPLFHVYMTDFSPDKIYNLCRKFQHQHGVDWNGYEKQFVLIFDYIKMDENSFKNNVQEYLVLGQITNMLKNKVAGQMNIPVLTYAQINPRSGHDNADINSSHLSGSNRIIMYLNEFSVLRKKTTEELENDGIGNGNIVWHVQESRNGGSYKGWIDYTTKIGVPAMKELRNVELAS